MAHNILRKQDNCLFRAIAWVVVLAFSISLITPPTRVYAQTLVASPMPALPPVGAMVHLSPAFHPPVLKGLKVYSENPFKFDFIVDTADVTLEGDKLKSESTKLIKYFLATLTTPEDDLWVNLSPYEKDRIIPDAFGTTEMGRDLLAQDYILKQLTASLIYPENDLGKAFWGRIYKKAFDLYGTTEIPINTFNKVWIIPDKAVVYVNGNSVFITDSHLKVMLEEDYVALRHEMSNAESRATSDQEQLRGITTEKQLKSLASENKTMEASWPASHDSQGGRDGSNSRPVATEILREIVIPAIEAEVNQGKNFAQLRQVYHSMILAAWFKRHFKESILGQSYVGQNKIAGIDIEDKAVKETIYRQYLEAFKKGVYNYVKEDTDLATNQPVPRKYFSGGFEGRQIDLALLETGQPEDATAVNPSRIVVDLKTYSAADSEAPAAAAKNDSTSAATDFALLSSTPQFDENSATDFSQYISYRKIFRAEGTEGNDVKGVTGDPKSFRQIVEDNSRGLEAAKIDFLITRQAPIEQSVLELVSNAADAMTGRAAPIGRFGMGALQMLAFVLDENNPALDKGAYITVDTKTVQESARRITFFKGADGKIKFTIASGEKSTAGTSVTIHFPEKIDRALKTTLVRFLTDRLNLFTKMRVFLKVDDKRRLLNTLDDHAFLNGDRVHYDMQDQEINVTLTDRQIIVEDQGSGMSDDVILDKYLIPRLGENQDAIREQTPEDIEREVHMFYRGPEYSDEETASRLVFQVSGINIQSLEVRGFNLPRELIIQLPSSTKLTLSRDRIEIDQSTHAAIRALARKIVTGNPLHQIDLMNGFMGAVRFLDEQNTRKDALQPLVDSAKEVLIPFVMQKDGLLLPNDKLFRQLDVPSATLFLDESLIYKISPNQIPGSEDISEFFKPGRLKKAFVVPFKPGSKVTYLETGPYLLLNQKIYERYKDLPLLINLRLNFYVGYGRRAPPKGWIVNQKQIDSQRQAKPEAMSVDEILENFPILKETFSKLVKAALNQTLNDNPKDIVIRYLSIIEEFAKEIPESMRLQLKWEKILTPDRSATDYLIAQSDFSITVLGPDREFLESNSAYFLNQDHPERLERYLSNLYIAGHLSDLRDDEAFEKVLSQIHSKGVAYVDEEILAYAAEVFKNKNLESYEAAFQGINEALPNVENESIKRVILRWLRIYKNDPKAAGAFLELLKQNYKRESMEEELPSDDRLPGEVKVPDSYLSVYPGDDSRASAVEFTGLKIKDREVIVMIRGRSVEFLTLDSKTGNANVLWVVNLGGQVAGEPVTVAFSGEFDKDGKALFLVAARNPEVAVISLDLKNGIALIEGVLRRMYITAEIEPEDLAVERIEATTLKKDGKSVLLIQTEVDKPFSRVSSEVPLVAALAIFNRDNLYIKGIMDFSPEVDRIWKGKTDFMPKLPVKIINEKGMPLAVIETPQGLPKIYRLDLENESFKEIEFQDAPLDDDFERQIMELRFNDWRLPRQFVQTQHLGTEQTGPDNRWLISKVEREYNRDGDKTKKEPSNTVALTKFLMEGKYLHKTSMTDLDIGEDEDIVDIKVLQELTGGIAKIAVLTESKKLATIGQRKIHIFEVDSNRGFKRIKTFETSVFAEKSDVKSLSFDPQTQILAALTGLTDVEYFSQMEHRRGANTDDSKWRPKKQVPLPVYFFDFQDGRDNKDFKKESVTPDESVSDATQGDGAKPKEIIPEKIPDKPLGIFRGFPRGSVGCQFTGLYDGVNPVFIALGENNSLKFFTLDKKTGETKEIGKYDAGFFKDFKLAGFKKDQFPVFILRNDYGQVKFITFDVVTKTVTEVGNYEIKKPPIQLYSMAKFLPIFLGIFNNKHFFLTGEDTGHFQLFTLDLPTGRTELLKEFSVDASGNKITDLQLLGFDAKGNAQVLISTASRLEVISVAFRSDDPPIISEKISELNLSLPNAVTQYSKAKPLNISYQGNPVFSSWDLNGGIQLFTFNAQEKQILPIVDFRMHKITLSRGHAEVNALEYTGLEYDGKPVIFVSSNDQDVRFFTVDFDKGEFREIKQFNFKSVMMRGLSRVFATLSTELRTLIVARTYDGSFGDDDDDVILYDFSDAMSGIKTLPVIRSGFEALTQKDDLSGLPSLVRMIVRFLKEERVALLEEEEPQPRNPDWQTTDAELTESVSLALLNYFYEKKAQEINSNPNLTLQEILQMLESLKGRNLADYTNIIRSAIEGQDKTQRAWVREVAVQNAGDATRRAREQGGLKSDQGEIEIRNFMNGEDWVFSVRDHGVGMNAWHLIRYFFPLDQSSKDYLTDTGNLGQGNYTLFSDFDRVFIRTSTGDGFIQELEIEKSQDQGPIVKRWEVLKGDYQGTEIRRIKKNENSDPQLESLFIQEALERFAGAIQSPEGKRKMGLEPTVNDIKITFNGEEFSEDIEMVEKTDLGGGFGELAVGRGQNKFQKRVIQDGIFIKAPDEKELKFIPEWLRIAFERFGGIHVSISRNIQLNIPRTGYAQEHKFIHRLQMGVLHNVIKTILKDYLERGVKIPGQPPDYFSNINVIDKSHAHAIVFLMHTGRYDEITDEMLEPFLKNPKDFFELLSFVPFTSREHNGLVTLNKIREELIAQSRLRDARSGAVDIQGSLSDIFKGKTLRGEFAADFEAAAGNAALQGGALSGLLGAFAAGERAEELNPNDAWERLPPGTKAFFDYLNQEFLEPVVGRDMPRIDYRNNPFYPAVAQAGGNHITWNLGIVGGMIGQLIALRNNPEALQAELQKSGENGVWNFIEVLVHESQHLVRFEQPGDHTHHAEEKIEGFEGKDERFGVRMGLAFDQILHDPDFDIFRIFNASPVDMALRSEEQARVSDLALLADAENVLRNQHGFSTLWRDASQDGFYIDDTFENHFSHRPKDANLRDADMVALVGSAIDGGDQSRPMHFIRFGDYAIADIRLKSVIPQAAHDHVLFLNLVANQYINDNMKYYSLAFLAQIYRQRESFRDATVLVQGSGGGIAALFALKLGAKRVVAIEMEKELNEIFESQIALNNIDPSKIILHRTKFANPDLKVQLKKEGPFDIVLANIGPDDVYEGANEDALELIQNLRQEGWNNDFLYIGAGFGHYLITNGTQSEPFEPRHSNSQEWEQEFLSKNFSVNDEGSVTLRIHNLVNQPGILSLYHSFAANIGAKQQLMQATDPALLADQQNSKGGIDLNPANLTIEQEGDAMLGVPTFDMKNLETIPFDGLVPVIIQIVPITNLPLLLGTSEIKEPVAQLSSTK